MHTNLPSPLERLYSAVLVLASTDGSIQERLAESFWQHICLIDTGALPPSVRDDFMALCGELKTLLGDRTRALDIAEAKAGECARKLILIYDAVLRSVP